MTQKQHPSPYTARRSRAEVVNQIFKETQCDYLRHSLCLRCVHATVRKIANGNEERLSVICRHLGEDQAEEVRTCSDFEDIDDQTKEATDTVPSGGDYGTGGSERFSFLDEQPPDRQAEVKITRPTLERLRAYRAGRTAEPEQHRQQPSQLKPHRGF